jgi:predicted 3-demethylubiquinone-9 3-methyltransferase (glyoxalase superfamily)
MQRITTHLWFDKEAKEAAGFYTSIFPDSKIKQSTTLHDTPSGSVDMLTIELSGHEFTLISAGPLFKFNPSISFLVSCATKDEVDALWRKLSKDGSALMELGAYPFSERYGWLQDRYGLSWQIMYAGERPIQQKITPVLMFVGQVSGKAEEAMRFYASLFPNSHVGPIMRDDKGAVSFGQFVLNGQQFAAMDSPRPHDFAFNEAISLMVHCDTQEEIDRYWNQLSADPNAEQCGWLKDRYGVSWQVVPTAMERMLASKDAVKIGRVTKAFLQMKKFDIAKLNEAYER